MSDLELTFDTATFQKQLVSAVRKAVRQTKGKTVLTGIGRRIQVSARRYCPVDTGRLKAAIVVGPVVEVGDDLEITVGVTLESLKNASSAAQNKIDSNIGKLLKGQRKTIGITNKMERRAAAVKVNYAPFVEYGTRKMGARPFLRPAIAEAMAKGVDAAPAEIEGAA